MNHIWGYVDMWLALIGGVLALAGTLLGATAGLSMHVDDDDAMVFTTRPWRSRVALALAGIGGALSVIGSLVGT